MSCCSKKRQLLNFFPAFNHSKSHENAAEIKMNNKNKIISDPVFKYTGKSLLEVKGVVGIRKYLFTLTRPVISVLSEDAPMMRGISELVEVNMNK